MEPPADLRVRFHDSQWQLAWSHVPQLQTWRIESPDEALFLKLVDHEWSVSTADEVARLRWAAGRLPVPEVVETGTGPGFDWILTRGLVGRNAVDAGLRVDPGRLAAALGRGLRQFHSIPVDDCPFDAGNGVALDRLRAMVTSAEFNKLASLRPNYEDRVVTHGDACLPNFLIERSEVTGFVDLGDLGVADRWRDIAVCLWSIERNLGPGFDDALFEGYGIDRDNRRIAFYQGLYWKL